MHTRDRVAIRCAEMNDEVNSGTGAKLLREVVTRSWRWGTIYRADSAASMGPDDPPMLWRTVCSKRGVLMRPLEMFDPRENIPPLP